MNEFSGRWVRRGGVLVPVLEPAPPKQRCRVCGGYARTGLCAPCKESTRERVHGSHAGFNQHTRRHELPCQACSDAEKVYQGKRYRRGQLSKTDRAWAEKAAVRGSWVMDERTNRVLGSLTTTREVTTMIEAINVIFDGPPGHESGRFVEVENDDGAGIRVGQWIERPDGMWALRIEPPKVVWAEVATLCAHGSVICALCNFVPDSWKPQL